MTGSDTSNSPQHSEDTPRAHAWCCLLLLLCGRVVCGVVFSACCLLSVMCGLRKNENRKITRENNCLPKSYARARGQGMWKPQPQGCCGNPGIWLMHAQGQNSLKGSPRATHWTDRAQTFRQRDPNGRIVPTASNVSDKGASTKRCARREKKR